MVRPCVARDFRRSVGFAVLHQCIRPLIGALLRTIMDISARASSLADRPRHGPSGSPVFACAGKTDPPSRLILSQTSAGGECGLGHCRLPFCAVPLLVPRASFLHPGLRLLRSAARRGRQGWPSLGDPAGCGVSRPRLDGLEHGARLTQVRTPLSHVLCIRIHAPLRELPRRCGQVCWQVRLPAHYDAAFFWRLRSRL